MALKTKMLKFLDITNYLAPGYSYAKFLKAYNVEQQKGFFPYEWVDDLHKLDATELPPHDAFYSKLKNTNIANEEYEYCQKVWRDNSMTNMRDFLIRYNNLHVAPFLEAVQKMFQFFQRTGHGYVQMRHICTGPLFALPIFDFVRRYWNLLFTYWRS